MLSKKVTDFRKKNTKRKISIITKADVFDRDKGKCIICHNGVSQPEYHHVFYGPDTNYGEDRNEYHQLVLLCNFCHHNLHNRGDNNFREQCKKYLLG